MREALCSTEGGLLTDLAILSLLALSAWLVLRSGRISLGQQAYFALGAYAAGLGTTLAQWPLAAALLAGMLLAALAAAAVALGTQHLSGLHYAVATLAFAEVLRLGLSAWHFQWRGPDGAMVGPAGVDGFRDIRWLLQNQVTPDLFVALAWAVLAAVLLAWAALARTRWGTSLQAVGQDDTLAAASGLPVARIRITAAALAGAVAALGGGLYAHRTTYIDPRRVRPHAGRARRGLRDGGRPGHCRRPPAGHGAGHRPAGSHTLVRRLAHGGLRRPGGAVPALAAARPAGRKHPARGSPLAAASFTAEHRTC